MSCGGHHEANCARNPFWVQAGAVGFQNVQDRYLTAGANMSGLTFLNSEGGLMFYNQTAAKKSSIGYEPAYAP